MEELDAVVFLSASIAQGAPPTEAQRAKLPSLLQTVSRWHQTLRQRKTRYLEIGLAHRGEFEDGPMRAEEAVDVYWRCLVSDSAELSTRTERLARILRTPSKIRLRCPRGTDLELEIDVDLVHPSDGVISDDDLAAGRSFDELPTGSVAAVPKPGTTQGTFVADWTLVVGDRYEEHRVILKDGRIREIHARGDVEPIRKRLAASAGDPDLVSEIRFGLNGAGPGPTGKPPLDACLAGTVSLGFGNNELIGGNVRSTMALLLPSFRITAWLEDRLLVENGQCRF